MIPKNLLILTLTTLIFLTACEPQAENQTTDQNPDLSGYSLTDQTLHSGALELEDVSMCEKINNTELKNACMTTLQDRKQLQKAIEELNPTLCESLSSKDEQASCKIKIDIEKKRKEKEIERSTLDEKTNKIIEEKDYTKCKELTDEALRNGCELNILINMGASKEDGIKNWCPKASSQETVDRCIAIYSQE